MNWAAYPTEMNKPVAMADVAGASGPAATGAGGPAVTGAGGPVIAGTRFLKYTPRSGKWRVTLMRTDDRKVEHGFSTPEEEIGSHPLGHSGVKTWVCPRDGSTEIDFIAPEEDVGSHPLEHSGVEKWAGPGNGSMKISLLEHSGAITTPAPIRKLVEWEPLEHLVPSVTLCWGSEPPIADVQEEPEEWEAIGF